MMSATVSRLFTFICLLLFILAGSENTPPKLLLISMDGFRHDYLSLPGLTPEDISNFKYLISNGVKADHIINVFPTVTYPNHFTLITGLYPESHGIVHNRFYDSDYKVKDYFWYDNRRDNFDPVWYDVGAEPIYVTNQKAGGKRRSGSALWPCGVGKVKEISPSKIIPDADCFTKMDFNKLVDIVVGWFTDKDDPINLGLLYFNEPDESGHHTGAGSDKVKEVIAQLNDVLGYLFDKLKENDLFDDVNIILTADHGFSNVTEMVALDEYGIIFDQDYTSGSKFDNHIVENLFPKDTLSELLQKFDNEELKEKVSVYVKDKDPYLQKLHYNNNTRIGPVVITGTNDGIYLVKSRMSLTVVGMHGYDPLKFESMHPFFLAMGPAFKKNYRVTSFHSVDIYPLMCHILELTPAPNNGSLENVIGLLKMNEDKELVSFTVTSVSFLVVIGLTVCVAGLYSICACHNARKSPRFLRAVKRPIGFSSLPTHHLLETEDEDDEF